MKSGIKRVGLGLKHRLQRAREILIGSVQKLSGRGLILAYHRVGRLTRDPQRLRVQPVHFIQHMEILKRDWNVVPLEELVAYIRRRRILPRVIAITFDDGYADNLYEAAPILEALDLAATVFVATRMIAEKREAFWDELDNILCSERALPLRLDIKVGPVVVDMLTLSPADRERAYFSLCAMLSDLSPPVLARVMGTIRDWAGIQKSQLRTPFLSIEELKKLAGKRSIQIGGHSQSHVLLVKQSEEMQRAEIGGCRRDLIEWLGYPPSAFSYPWALTTLPQAKTTKLLVQEAGFVCGVDTVRGSVGWIGTDLYCMPRAIVRDSPGEYFQRWLEGTFAYPWLDQC